MTTIQNVLDYVVESTGVSTDDICQVLADQLYQYQQDYIEGEELDLEDTTEYIAQAVSTENLPIEERGLIFDIFADSFPELETEHLEIMALSFMPELEDGNEEELEEDDLGDEYVESSQSSLSQDKVSNLEEELEFMKEKQHLLEYKASLTNSLQQLYNAAENLVANKYMTPHERDVAFSFYKPNDMETTILEFSNQDPELDDEYLLYNLGGLLQFSKARGQKTDAAFKAEQFSKNASKLEYGLEKDPSEGMSKYITNLVTEKLGNI